MQNRTNKTKEKLLMNKTNDKTKKMASNIMKSLSRTDFAKFSEDDMKIIKSFAEMICSEEDLSCIDSLFLDKLPYAFKDKFYRRIWTEHVKKDVLSMYDVTDEKAASVAQDYVNGRYDCNLSYWANLENLIEEKEDKQMKKCFSLHECLTKKLQIEVSEIKRCSALDIDFLTNEGDEDETQIDVFLNILTKAGTQEVENLFGSLCEELNTKNNRILSCTVVASADTEEELEKMGY